MQKIIILDFGGQYAHLIANRIRRLGVFSEILPNDTDIKTQTDVKGIIISGGPDSVYDEDSPKPHKDLFKTDIPILGLCYGHQLMAQFLGGIVSPGKIKEYGTANLLTKDNPIFEGLDDKEQVWMSHGDTVSSVPQDFEIIGSTKDCKIAAMANRKTNYYGFQFHPEVTHTTNGLKILENFVFNICNAKKNWDSKQYTKRIIEDIKTKAKDKKVFMLVSGGVDSTVCFTLLNKAIGQENVYGLFIDNGLVRKDEMKLVDKAIKDLGYQNFHSHDASDIFISRLKEIYDPETKREIIGNTFIDVQKEVLKNLDLDPEEWLLGQGTIYPDTIETKGTKNADLIKTHHNRVPEIQKMIDQGKVIEPLSQLYKDEVREVGLEIGLPKDLVWRHPFPGPGLGVRCLCNDKDHEQLKIKSEYPGFIIPIKSVGVQGDSRTYRHPFVLTLKDNWDKLGNISTNITNRFAEINRVLLFIDGKKDLKLIKAYITKKRLDKLRQADHIVNKALFDNNLMQDIWQFPIVMIPYGENESIILRPVYSKEAMTAEFGKIDMEIVGQMAKEILALGFDAVYYDITNKPPGTIEWE
jgi:GMP synthase (glutamine-hydrolysing)